MGAPKQKWTAEEEEALIAGINKHGAGKWKNIQNDPEFSDVLAARSNIDMKDKWRNMSATATGEGSRPKGAKAKATTPKVPKMTPSSIFQSPPSSSQPTTEDAAKHTPRYDGMILEALSNITDPNGADICFINDFIEQRHEVPSNFRRLLSAKLRRLVTQGKLERVKLLSHESKSQKSEASRNKSNGNFHLILCKRGEPVIMAFETRYSCKLP
ncbi:hypothetical protein MKW92_052067 [Papaver armeniacum]|nr:hypothetical protein MKW92_052067 [Papaver armeniacum]